MIYDNNDKIRIKSKWVTEIDCAYSTLKQEHWLKKIKQGYTMTPS